MDEPRFDTPEMAKLMKALFFIVGIPCAIVVIVALIMFIIGR